MTVKDSIQGDVSTNYSYDANGNLHSVSNPHRSATASTDGITTYGYDALGRPTSQTQPDSYNRAFSYSGNATTITDQRHNQHQRTVDGISRVTQILEPGLSTQTPTVQTNYTYTGLTFGMTQNGVSGEAARIRSFTYDSLSRLITATTPESGTVCYGTWDGGVVGSGHCVNGYDSNGNLNHRTDARNVTSNFYYDSLNRLYQKDYTIPIVNGVPVAAATPTVTYQYDVTTLSPGTNVVGRLTDEKVMDGSTLLFERSIAAYDPVGRVSTEAKCVPSICPTLHLSNYIYDYAGDETSASVDYLKLFGINQITISYGYNDTGKQTSETFTSASGNLNGRLMHDVTYTPLGAISAANATETRTYDSRGRSTGITYTPFTAISNNTVTNQNYTASYHYYPNGSVKDMTDSVVGSWSYNYDNLNRLQSAQSSSNSIGTQTYTYDSFGNRLSQNGIVNVSNTFSNAHNQADCSGCYDAAGNLLQDTGSSQPKSYAYDAEGRLAAISGGYQYIYDGESTRIGVKLNGALIRAYLMDSNGQFSIQLDGSGNQMAIELFGANRHLATISDDVYLPSLDVLGTERTRNGVYGGTVENCTNLPFGDLLTCDAPDSTPLHFTGLEHISESGLEHALFREYNSASGRWMSPDPYDGSYNLSDPQSLNRYAYVGNNPLSFSDPSGLYCNTVDFFVDGVYDSSVTTCDSGGGGGGSGGGGGGIMVPVFGDPGSGSSGGGGSNGPSNMAPLNDPLSVNLGTLTPGLINVNFDATYSAAFCFNPAFSYRKGGCGYICEHVGTSLFDSAVGPFIFTASQIDNACGHSIDCPRALVIDVHPGFNVNARILSCF